MEELQILESIEERLLSSKSKVILIMRANTQSTVKFAPNFEK